MTLQQLHYALAVEEHLSFLKAADACHVAQPSLSAQVKKLEESLGVVLFQRSTSAGVLVTDAGREALRRARQILKEARDLQDYCASFTGEVSGKLNVGVIPTIGPFLLPLFVGGLRRRFPQLELEVLEHSTQVLMQELYFGRIDVAILSPPHKAPAHMIEKPLYYEPFLIYGSKGHPVLQHGPQVKMSLLSDYTVTLLDETHCMRDQVVAACSLAKARSHDVLLRQGSLQTLVSLVETHDSYTLIPRLSVDVLSLKYRREGLREIVHQTPFRKVSLIYNKNLVRRKLVDALHSVISDSLPATVTTKAPARGMIIEPKKEHFSTAAD